MDQMIQELELADGHAYVYEIGCTYSTYYMLFVSVNAIVIVRA